MAIRFGILGPLTVEIDGRPRLIASARQRAILGTLLLNANRVVAADVLVDALWGEDAATDGTATLQVHVSRLRSALGLAPADGPLRTVEPGYRIDASEETLDAQAFDADVSAARRLASGGEHAAAARRYRAGLARWRGRPLSDIEGISLVEREVERLEMLHAEASAGWVEAELRCGNHADVLPELTRLVADHPYDERLRGLFMTALYRSGRHADALAAYQDLRRVLDDDLGLEPGPELELLERQILQHDLALGVSGGDAGQPTRAIFDGAATLAILRAGGRDHDVSAAVTTIGRSPDRTVVIPDDSVSRRHAEIRRTAAGVFRLVDMGSTNGSRVNGEPVTEADLHDGDVILLGDVAVTFLLVSTPGRD